MAKGKQGRRRSHLALKPLTLVACTHCKRNIIPHTVCKFCGFYKGKEIVDILVRQLKRQEKKRQQQAK